MCREAHLGDTLEKYEEVIILKVGRVDNLREREAVNHWDRAHRGLLECWQNSVS